MWRLIYSQQNIRGKRCQKRIKKTNQIQKTLKTHLVDTTSLATQNLEDSTNKDSMHW